MAGKNVPDHSGISAIHGGQMSKVAPREGGHSALAETCARHQCVQLVKVSQPLGDAQSAIVRKQLAA